MPTPARTHLPIKPFIVESNILDEESARDNEADLALLRLPAPSLRGTFAKAYALLTRLVAQIGWDELLRSRSAVFVMEEEYRMQKKKPANGSSPEDGEDAGGLDNDTGDRRVDSSPPPLPPKAEDTGSFASSTEGIAPASGEGIAGEEGGDEEVLPNGGTPPPPPLERPQPSQAPSDSGAEQDDESEEEEGDAFSSKRLCERWLDNLFMVLYEDLRVYTIWRAEISHFKTQRAWLVLSLPRQQNCADSAALTHPQTCRTARRAPNGRSSVTSPSGCTTRRRPRTPTSDASTPSSPPRPGSDSSRPTPTKATSRRRSTPRHG